MTSTRCIAITPRETTMPQSSLHKPYQPSQDVPDEFEPSSLPVEPDEGPVPAGIPDDPDHDRAVDPRSLSSARFRQAEQPAQRRRC